MRLTRSALRRRVCAISIAGLVAGSLLTPSFAEASATSFDMDAASTLAERFGDRTAGTYLDANSGKMVVTVTDAATAAQVRAAGAVARFVPRSAAQLASAAAELDRSTWIPGTSWAVDPMSNQVVVSADTSVTGAKLTHLTSVMSRLGDAARLEHVAGTFSTRIRGGDAIFGGGVPLFARLQRAQRRQVLLPDRRALRSNTFSGMAVATPSAADSTPASPATTTPSPSTRMASATPAPSPCSTGPARTSPGPRTRSSASRSPAAAARPGCTAARCWRSTPRSTTRRAASPA